ncbi:AI-2E family transporter [Prosthecochloris sp. N3]|uniref:AI-2E family transporter n=1 Tax=Prosthecochloris ethylica TaxID=2743976 RepID=A0ABR9XNZ9_9CHLB|nr:AI-2E family transporter [Prosthecochloris ethylica]MBF0585819.1 AI-2E family transporter [Prosthecochloris ethylica]MBF0635729.1 AI-2E family transporter [Prosthecochloris ethylica]NUK47027.1 AI-2E family transporter [Prosthecochloris ethylica]
MNRAELNNLVLLVVVVIISVLFVSMISNFLMVILLAGIFSGLAMPVYRFFERLVKGNKSLSSVLTLGTVSLIGIFPLLALLGIVAAQAIRISRLAGPWIEKRLEEPAMFSQMFSSLPFYDVINSYRDLILQKAGELVSKMSTFLFENISSFTLSTVQTLFLFFVFIYTMFFFLRDGHQFLERILYYLPLQEQDQSRMLDKFVSVTRATIRGTFVVGFIQGALAGIALHIAGIEGAAFWGAIMTVLSVIPVLGTVLVWGPAVIYLYTTGEYISATGLLVFCGVLVGSIDNILRPILVGRDTKMHELLIFFGTIGGIGLFGIAGFIVGPVIAALFVTVWEIYGETFQEYLNPSRQQR